MSYSRLTLAFSRPSTALARLRKSPLSIGFFLYAISHLINTALALERDEMAESPITSLPPQEGQQPHGEDAHALSGGSVFLIVVSSICVYACLFNLAMHYAGQRCQAANERRSPLNNVNNVELSEMAHVDNVSDVELGEITHATNELSNPSVALSNADRLAKLSKKYTCRAEYYCSLTKEVMTDPVVTADGHTYERGYIEKWLKSNDTSPLTNLKLAHKELTPNIALKKLIDDDVYGIEKAANSDVEAPPPEVARPQSPAPGRM